MQVFTVIILININDLLNHEFTEKHLHEEINGGKKTKDDEVVKLWHEAHSMSKQGLLLDVTRTIKYKRKVTIEIQN